jgi:hypothetical protein
MKNLFSRWHDVVLDFEGVSVPLKLRAPINAEARELRRKVDAWRREAFGFGERRIDFVSGKTAEAPPDDYDLLEHAFGDEWARETFRRNVRLQSPMVDDDGAEIAGGAELYDVMGAGERVGVLLKLDDMVFLSAKEGKASPSPSTSPAAVEAPICSPATTTGPGDGTGR